MRSSFVRRVLFRLSVVCGVVLFFSGCLTGRGVMYLEKERVDDYLAKEKRPSNVKGKKKKKVEASIEKARLLLRKVPDGNRIMGGFCTKKYVREQFQEMVDAAPKCRVKIRNFQNQSNQWGIVFWSILGASIGSGIALGVGVAAAPDGDTRIALGLTFGILVAVTAIANTAVPFSEWQDEARVRMKRIDNYMWTLRKRVQIEVCNAKSRDVAFDRMDNITREFRLLCNAPEKDDGIYRMPTRSKDAK